MKPSTAQYTGRTQRMSWATKRFFRYVDAAGNDQSGECWDLHYETPEQEAEHKRLIESARPARP
jgi:hypothetical protein